MGKIKKILENELVGGTQSTDVYPVTSVKAVYDENNERLDHILNRRGTVNISTNYNSDHTAEVLTLEEAISSVPDSDRVVGFLGSVLTSSGWKLYQFGGESIASWEDVSLWTEISHRNELITAINSLTNNLFSNEGRITTQGSVSTSQMPLFYTDYIDLEGLSTITVLGFASENTSVISFYDSGKSFISSLYGSSNSDRILTVDIPSNAKYCRCTGKKGSSFCIGMNLNYLSDRVRYNTIKYINVSELYGDVSTDSGDYYTLQTAREKVPVKDRIKGQLISFLSGYQKWELWMWQGMSGKNDNPTGWYNDNLWFKIDFNTSKDVQDINYWILGNYSDATLEDGYVISYLSGIRVENANTAITGYLVCAKSSHIRLTMTVKNDINSQSGIAFYDSEKNFISGVARPYQEDVTQGSKIVDVPIPENAIYFRTTYWNSTIIVSQLPFSCQLITIVPSKEDVDNIKEDVDNIKEDVDNILGRTSNIDYSSAEISEDLNAIHYETGDFASSTIMGHTGYIDCVDASQIELSVPTGALAASKAGIAFYDSNKQYIIGYQRPIAETSRVIRQYNVPEGAAYFRTTYFNAANREIYGEFYCMVIKDVSDSFVVQSTGDSTTKVMSQAAVTRLLENSSFVENLNQDEICDFYAINCETGEISPTSTTGCTRYIDCEEGQVFLLPYIGFSSDNLGYAFYDSDKTYLSGGSQKGADFNILSVTAPKNARYIRFSGRTYAWLKGAGFLNKELSINVDYSSALFANGKRPYQSGYIYFSVKVNQKVNTYWDGSVSDDFTEDYECTTGVLALPKNYSPNGKPVPLIMYCHGYSHGVWYNHWGDTDNFREQKDYWVSKGYAVFDCNGARNNNMTVHFTGAGSNQFVEGYRKCFEYIHEHYNVEDNIYVVGGSAGSPTAIQYCYTWNNVKALAILSGWTDLFTCSWGQNVRGTFVEYLGFNDTTTYEKEKTVGHDPALRILSIGEDEVIPHFPVPVKAWIGSLENSHVLYAALYRFINALRKGGCIASICEKVGLDHTQVVSGHSLSVDNDVIDWFSAH